MRLFRKPTPLKSPEEAKKYRKETHDAATSATIEVSKLNKVMGNGITLKIYLAAGGHKK